jgi:hypothetical protein
LKYNTIQYLFGISEIKKSKKAQLIYLGAYKKASIYSN